ncbi:hypothetical protein DCS_06683 [Drechmeria coniospora]|uniref:Secreted protein n=1 Tax=Drechmeria coniospora TaxID=98403 RepID=A0A151GCE0_DRECN|nr:hypothetical protein DCS_06683 [Drechmeria coniospora]KYK54723.1 hypothetical protein DCS_06683 [Drechmeria coniospora]
MRPSLALVVPLLARAVPAADEKAPAAQDAQADQSAPAAGCPSDSVHDLLQENLHCPVHDADAYASAQVAYQNAAFVESVRVCIPALHGKSVFEKRHIPGTGTHEHRHDLACTLSTSLWGCAHGLQCQYKRRCVRGPRLACPRKSKELHCKMLDGVPEGYGPKFDKLRLLVEFGSFPAAGSLYANVRVKDTIKTVKFGKTVRGRVVLQHDVDLEGLFGAQAIDVKDLSYLGLVYEPPASNVPLTFLDSCNKLVIKGTSPPAPCRFVPDRLRSPSASTDVKLVLHQTGSGLDFSYNPVAVRGAPGTQPETGSVKPIASVGEGDVPLTTARAIDVCAHAMKPILNLPLPLAGWQTSIGLPTETLMEKKCNDSKGHPGPCGVLSRYRR